MIKRPLNSRFSDAVLKGRKTTTIRDNPWPVGKPIMLYNWSGAAYRSKQIDVAIVIVHNTTKINIRQLDGGEMVYIFDPGNGIPLHESEGFESREEMDDWFRRLVKPGQTISKTLMRFRLANAKDQAPAGRRLPASASPARECVECGDILKPNYPNPICSQCERKQNTQNYDD